MFKKFERSVVTTSAHHVQIKTVLVCVVENVIVGNGFVEIVVGIEDVMSMINVVLRKVTGAFAAYLVLLKFLLIATKRTTKTTTTTTTTTIIIIIIITITVMSPVEADPEVIEFNTK